MNNRVEKALNEQIHKEASSSQYYLAMASWAENNGLNGTAKFMYTHSDEERFHMLKLVKFVNERGGKAVIPSVEKPPLEFSTLKMYLNLFLNMRLVLRKASIILWMFACKKRTIRLIILCNGMLQNN